MKTSRPPVKQVAGTLSWGLALQGALLLAAAYLQRNAMGAAAVQAAMTEFGAGRLGVTWSDPTAPPPTFPAIARRVLRGAGYAAAAAAGILVLAFATKAASYHGVSIAGVLPLFNGLLLAVLLSVRDELLLRGVVLRAFGRAVPSAAELVVCGLVAAAAAWGSKEAATSMETFSAGVLGVAFAALWRIDRGAWMAWGANAALHYLLNTVVHGAVFDIRIAQGSWAQGLL